MNFDSEKVADEIERVLTNAGKIKILRLLMKNPDRIFTRYEIGKKTPLNPKDITNDLDILVQVGWVREFRIHHLKKYAINLDDELTRQFFDFFRKIKYV